LKAKRSKGNKNTGAERRSRKSWPLGKAALGLQAREENEKRKVHEKHPSIKSGKPYFNAQEKGPKEGARMER